MTRATSRGGLYQLLAITCLMSGCGGGDSGATSSTSGATSSSSGATSSSSGTGSSSSGGTTSVTPTDVLTFHNDTMRTGQNLTETALTPANVNSSSFGLLRTLAADGGPVDAMPLIANGVTIGGSSHNVVYVATEHDNVYAYDADTGAPLLNVSLLPNGETPSDALNCVDNQPGIGILATPVIVRGVGANGSLFVVAMSKDGSGNYHQRIHSLDLTSLADQVAAVEITASAPGNGPNSSNGELIFGTVNYDERGALLATNSQIYTVWASHCDTGTYNGWIIAYDQSTLTQTAALNYTPNGSMGAIWNVGGLAADSSGTVYGISGNGTFDETLDGNGLPIAGDYGNTAIKVSAAASSLSITDYYAAANTVSQSANDDDLGSSSLLLLPDQTDASGAARHLMVGGGKDGLMVLLDRDNLGKFNAAADTAYQSLQLSASGLYSAYVYFNGSLYIADVGGTLKSFTLAQAKLPSTPSSQSSTTFSYPGTSPSVSANGTANAILWALLSTPTPGSAAVLYAYNPANLGQEYYNSTQAGSRDAFGNGEKFITPVIANGKVFVDTPTGVAVFGLLQ